MKTLFGKAVLAATLAVSALTAAAPAQARDGYRHRGGGDDAAIAIGAGIIGLAIGAAIASDRNDRYDDRDYYYDSYPRYRGGYYYNSYPQYYRYDYRDARRDYRRHERREHRRWHRGDRYRDGYRGW